MGATRMAAVRASGVCIALLSRMTAVLAQLDADDDDEAVMGYEGDDPAEPPSNSTKGSATITIVLLVGGAVLVTLVIFAVYTYTFPSHSQPSSDIILSPLECGRTTDAYLVLKTETGSSCQTDGLETVEMEGRSEGVAIPKMRSVASIDKHRLPNKVWDAIHYCEASDDSRRGSMTSTASGQSRRASAAQQTTVEAAAAAVAAAATACPTAEDMGLTSAEMHDAQTDGSQPSSPLGSPSDLAQNKRFLVGLEETVQEVE